MLWKKYYNEVTFPFSLLWVFTRFEKQVFLAYIPILVPLFLATFYHNFSLYFFFHIIILICITFLYSYFIFKFYLLFIFNKKYLNKNTYTISLNQKSFLERETKIKNSFLFLFTLKKNKHKIENTSLKQLVYIEGQKLFIEKLESDYVTLHDSLSVIRILLLTFFIFWGFLSFIDLLKIIRYPNTLFLISGIFISYTLLVAYLAVSQIVREWYYLELKNSILKKYNGVKIEFIISENKPIKNEIEKNERLRTPMNPIGIVFGVLFTLYLTLMYSKIYPTTVIQKDTAQIKKSINILELNEYKEILNLNFIEKKE